MLFLPAACLALLSACTGDKPKTAFSGEKALAYAAEMVALGPRNPNSAGAQKGGDWIVAQMKARGADTVIVQAWDHVTLKGDTLHMRNFLARFNSKSAQKVLYVTHWDTRPIAESDRTLGNRNTPIPGANDGASGCGLFVALADAFKVAAPNVGVDLLFVDGEDYGSFDDYANNPDKNDVLIGSRWFATHLPEPGYKPIYGVLWDMIGDAKLDINQESNSINAAPEVVSRVWSTAQDLGYEKFFLPVNGGAITDDHVPLIRAGLRVIDVIDIKYEDANGDTLHHTLQDTMDKISAASLQVVGDVALALVTR
ncbi:MAG: Peptidase family [Gemmatimonadetes bacterium]|nr:Peptidase family [Gemmatimonadota bacterium]